MSQPASLEGAAWLATPALQKLLAVLSADGAEARIAGGAVRNALLGEPVTDIDIATTDLPDETIRRAEAAGFRTVPTGYDHGTVTVLVSGQPFEVTTLRADVETDGRRAKVAFGTDWQMDAERRDFTINGMYAKADGTVVDLVGGQRDLEARRLRFIGDAATRIGEDYLRILRFFRFFAWYGEGRPDADGLKACARLKEGLAGLSAERVWAELKKLLSAPDPSRALLWMRQTGVLTAILPESEKWGIDLIHTLVETERALGWDPDAMLRLEGVLPPDAARMRALAKRLRMSKEEGARLQIWAATPAPEPAIAQGAFRRMLYRSDRRAVIDRLQLALASARGRAAGDDAALLEAGSIVKLLGTAQKWEAPMFPVSGTDLKEKGVPAGPAIGRMLKRLEERWIESDFTLSRDALLESAAQDGA